MGGAAILILGLLVLWGWSKSKGTVVAGEVVTGEEITSEEAQDVLDNAETEATEEATVTQGENIRYEQYTMAYVEHMRALVSAKPSVAKYISTTTLQQMACRTQEELDLLKEYHSLYKQYLYYLTMQGLTEWLRTGGTEKDAAAKRKAIWARMEEIKSLLSHVFGEAESMVSSIYWEEGGAGYSVD